MTEETHRVTTEAAHRATTEAAHRATTEVAAAVQDSVAAPHLPEAVSAEAVVRQDQDVNINFIRT